MAINAGGNGSYKVRLNGGGISSLPAGATLNIVSSQTDATIGALDANLQFTVGLPANTADTNLHLEADATNATAQGGNTVTGTFDDPVIPVPPPTITTVEIIKIS